MIGSGILTRGLGLSGYSGLIVNRFGVTVVPLPVPGFSVAGGGGYARPVNEVGHNRSRAVQMRNVAPTRYVTRALPNIQQYAARATVFNMSYNMAGTSKTIDYVVTDPDLHVDVTNFSSSIKENYFIEVRNVEVIHLEDNENING